MDASKLRERAEKLLAMAKEQERKEKELLQKKIATLVIDHVKVKGYEFGQDFADRVKTILEPASESK